MLDVLKESKERGFNPILRVYQAKGNIISEGDSNTNILDNIFSDEMMDYINIMNKYDDYLYLIPYFIFFSNEEVIKRWFNEVRNSKLIYKIAKVISSQPDIYNKFKSIISDDISDASSMDVAGFSD